MRRWALLPCILLSAPSLRAQEPDLIIQAISIFPDREPEIGQTIEVTVTIRNQSSVPIPEAYQIQVDLYHNQASAPSPYEPGDEFDYIFGLGANSSWSFYFYPTSFNPGVWRMWAQVDTYLLIDETSETNNVAEGGNVRWHEPPVPNGYKWPIANQDLPHNLNSVLDEYRAGHFHDGIDVDAYQGTDVLSVSSGVFRYTLDRIGVFVGNNMYYHLQNYDDRLPAQDQWVLSAGQRLADTDNLDHVHFTDGPDQSEVNPLRSDGIWPSYTDCCAPMIGELTVRSDPGGAPLPKTDVHGDVDFIAEVKDKIWTDLHRAGIYRLGYRIDQGADIMNFQFDDWLPNACLGFVYDGAEPDPGFLRYIPTNAMCGNGSWNSRSVQDGSHTVVVIAEDKSGVLASRTEKAFAIIVTNESWSAGSE